jgi:hypothetical protein
LGLDWDGVIWGMDIVLFKLYKSIITHHMINSGRNW